MRDAAAAHIKKFGPEAAIRELVDAIRDGMRDQNPLNSAYYGCCWEELNQALERIQSGREELQFEFAAFTD